MDKKVFKSLINTLIVLMLVINSSCMLVGAETDTTYYYEKIDTSLQEKLEELDNDDEICVSVWVNDIDKEILQENVIDVLQDDISNGEIPQSAVDSMLDTEQVDYDNNVAVAMELSNDASADLTTEEAYYVLHTEREEAKELHEVNNSEIYDELFTDEDNQPEVVYMCSYAPNMDLMLTKSEILDIALSDKVDSMYYVDTEAELVSDEDENYNLATASTNYYDTTYFNVTGLAQCRDVWKLKGEGMKVGMIEVDNNVNLRYLSNSNITLINGISNSGSLHATYVALIMVGNSNDKIGNYIGAIPNAELYSVYDEGARNIKSSIENLIARDVNVINCSFGNSSYNNYDDIARLYDYMSCNHKVCFVLASGNDGSTGVASNNMSYNAIVVGNCDNNGALDETSSRPSSYYIPNQTDTKIFGYKPDIVAPGENIDIPLASVPIRGTSFSAPMVTSAVIQLQQANPSLLLKNPNLVKALLLSGSKITTAMDSEINLSTTTSNEISCSRKYGAGMLNAVNAYTALMDYGYYATSTTSSHSTGMQVTKNAIVRGTKMMRVCLTWDKVIETLDDGTLEEYDLDSFRLAVITPSGLRYTSQYLYDNKQMVSFETSESGTYTFLITRVGTTNSEHIINYALAFSLQ